MNEMSYIYSLTSKKCSQEKTFSTLVKFKYRCIFIVSISIVSVNCLVIISQQSLAWTKDGQNLNENPHHYAMIFEQYRGLFIVFYKIQLHLTNNGFNTSMAGNA